MAEPTPLIFKHVRMQKSEYEGSAGTIRVELITGERIDIEMFQRPGYPSGIMMRGLDCQLDVQPEVANVVIIKPRGR